MYKLIVFIGVALLITACGSHVEVADQSKVNDQIKALNDRLAELEIELTTVNQQIKVLEDAGMAVNEVINPCGDQVGQYDEVILKLSSGQVVAFFEQGDKRFLSILDNGTYMTTDVQACRFSITDGEISY